MTTGWQKLTTNTKGRALDLPFLVHVSLTAPSGSASWPTSVTPLQLEMFDSFSESCHALGVVVKKRP